MHVLSDVFSLMFLYFFILYSLIGSVLVKVSLKELKFQLVIDIPHAFFLKLESLVLAWLFWNINIVVYASEFILKILLFLFVDSFSKSVPLSKINFVIKFSLNQSIVCFAKFQIPYGEVKWGLFPSLKQVIHNQNPSFWVCWIKMKQING